MHLLKICIPYPRPKWEQELVHTPLNSTTLFRLIARMQEIGYPAHWFSEILQEIFDGRLATTARAPRQKTVDEKVLKRAHPAIILA